MRRRAAQGTTQHLVQGKRRSDARPAPFSLKPELGSRIAVIAQTNRPISKMTDFWISQDSARVRIHRDDV